MILAAQALSIDGVPASRASFTNFLTQATTSTYIQAACDRKQYIWPGRAAYGMLEIGRKPAKKGHREQTKHSRISPEDSPAEPGAGKRYATGSSH
jgi:hypothetical protein